MKDGMSQKLSKTYLLPKYSIGIYLGFLAKSRLLWVTFVLGKKMIFSRYFTLGLLDKSML